MILVQIVALARDNLELGRRHRRGSFGFNPGRNREGVTAKSDWEMLYERTPRPDQQPMPRICAKIYQPARDKYRETASSGEVLISRALVSCSLDFDLRCSIYPNFRLPFIHLDPAG